MLCLVKLWTKLKYKINVRLASNKKDSSNSRLIFTEADSFLSEVKTVYNYQNFSKVKKCLILVIIQLNQIIMMIQSN